MRIDRPIGFLSGADSEPDFEIPVMENVHILRLQKPRDEVERELAPFPFFPPGFTLSHSFPNLQSLWFFNWRGDISTDLLGSNCRIQVLPTLKQLQIEWATFEPLTGFSKLVQIFPKLTKIKIEYLSNFRAVAPILWKFKELEELTIGLYVGSYSNSNEMGAIDSAITGFTMETCQKLRDSDEFLEWAKNAAKTKKSPEKEENGGKNRHPLDPDSEFSELPETIKSLRVNPSICHLANLKSFSVEFWDGDSCRKDSYFLISELSGLFAFDLMPQLQVQLIPATDNTENLERMRNHLEEMEPYVNLSSGHDE